VKAATDATKEATAAAKPPAGENAAAANKTATAPNTDA